MWLSQAARQKLQPVAVDRGSVTIGGEDAAVLTKSEKRGVEVLSPGGYIWLPVAGQDAVTVDAGGNDRYIAGCVGQDVPSDLQPGEIYIKSNGGASLVLKNNGALVLTGSVRIEGSLTVNGNKIG